MLREFYFWILSLGGCVVKYVVLDRRQAVRHWVLVPAFAGSNPAGPAIFVSRKIKKRGYRISR